MANIRKLRAGRIPDENPENWVGQLGTIFYNEDTGKLRIADGVTPGGNPLQIAAEDIELAFGEFVANANTLSVTGINNNMNLEAKGTGQVNVVGQFHVHTTDGGLELEPIFRVDENGTVRILAPDAGTTVGAVSIIGNADGSYFPPNQPGIILHVTGNDSLVSRNYFDALNNYPLIVGRRYNGSAENTTPVLNGELFFRIAGQASNDNGFETFGPCQIDWVATENQTPNNQGGEIRIRATPNGANAISSITQVAAFNATTGVTAIKFNGPLTGNIVSTTANIGNLTVSGTITGQHIQTVRNVGTVPANGTLTVNIATDSIVYCQWSDNMNLAYSNFTSGKVVKVLATKLPGSGTDTLSLDGVTAAQVSSGATTINAAADTTTFIEIICTGTSLANVFIKL